MDAETINKNSSPDISYKTALRYSILLGWLGVDRFYMGDIRIGVLKLCLFCYFIPWIVDIFVIRSHKDDWDEWIGAKQVKRAGKKAEAHAIQAKQLAADKLHKERAANGRCPECDSTNLTAVSETTNKLSMTGALFQLSDPRKHVANDKIVSVTKRVCLNCGHQF